jgi:von Willebrand factor type A domain
MRAWGGSGIFGAGARHRRSVVTIVTIAAIAAIGLSVVAVSSADITNNTKLRSVDNNTAVTSGPGGSVLAIDVEYTVPSGGSTWSSTRVTDSDQSLCFDHGNHSSGTATELLTSATSPSNERLTAGTSDETPVVKTYSSNNCSGTVLDTKSLSFSVIPITTNPTLAQSCGIDVVLVLDETGSIASAGATQNVRNAAIAFANGIADTGSKLALVEFNTTGSVTIPLTSVTSSWVSGAFTTHLNTNYNPTGRTNWEAGLLAAQTVASANLVVFITDGNPNKPGVDAVPDGDVSVM